MRNEFPEDCVKLYWCVSLSLQCPCHGYESWKYFGTNRQIMERNEACPEILLARLQLFIYLFPAIFLSSFLCLSFYLRGLGIVSLSMFHVLLPLGGECCLPLTLSFFVSHIFKRHFIYCPWGALHYALTCSIMHSFMQPLPYVNALYD